jgi:hypothetical protein
MSHFYSMVICGDNLPDDNTTLGDELIQNFKFVRNNTAGSMRGREQRRSNRPCADQATQCGRSG